MAGGKSRTEARVNQQALSPAEEIALVRWITRITATGYPATHPLLREMAQIIRLRRVAQINDSSIELVSYPPLSKDWVQRFLKRHPQLGTVFSLSIEASRIKEATPERLMRWFNEFKRVIDEENIRLEDIYNMDETGFALGTLAQTCVIVNKRCDT